MRVLEARATHFRQALKGQEGSHTGWVPGGPAVAWPDHSQPMMMMMVMVIVMMVVTVMMMVITMKRQTRRDLGPGLQGSCPQCASCFCSDAGLSSVFAAVPHKCTGKSPGPPAKGPAFKRVLCKFSVIHKG